VLIVYRAPTVFDWLPAVQLIVAARAVHLEDVRSVAAVPSRNGSLVIELGGVLQAQFLPLPERLANWMEIPQWQPLHAPLTKAFSSAVESLSIASGLFTGIGFASLTRLERTLAQRSLRGTVLAMEELAEISASQVDREPIEMALDLLGSLLADVEQQIKLVEDGVIVEASIATQLLPDRLEEASGQAQQIELVRLLLLECDVKPEGVIERLAEAGARLAANGDTGP
jgi:hypothetical protein